MKIIDAIVAIFSGGKEFFEWSDNRVLRSKQAHAQKSLGEADFIVRDILKLKPLLLTVNSNKDTKRTILRLFANIKDFQAHRAKC